MKYLNNTIEVAEAREYYPLSGAQKGIYLKYSQDDTAYNVSGFFKIEGNLDIERFRASVMQLVKRHDAFRTSFILMDGEPVQKVHENVELSFVITKCDERRIKDTIIEFIKPFDLSKPPLVRAVLIKVAENSFRFILDMHHIIADGVSTSILLKEIKSLYQGKKLNELTLQYKDYAVWYNNLLQSDEMKEQKEYWKRVFATDPSILNLPVDLTDWFSKPIVGDGVSIVIPAELSTRLNRILRKYINYNLTLNTLLFAIYGLLLNKYCGQDDIVIGTISAGRNQIGVSDIVGPFINVLPIRVQIDTEKSFIEYAESVKRSILGAYENQECPFDMILENVSSIRKNAFNPIFDTLFVYNGVVNTGYMELDETGLKMIAQEPALNTATFGIKVDVFKTETEELIINADYNSAMFYKEKMKVFLEHFVNICRQICDYPEKKINQINILSSEEEKRIAIDFNNTSKPYPKDISLTELFEQQAAKSPLGVALAYEGGTMSYDELNKSANKVAWFLRSKGIGPDDLVGINVERNGQLIIGILGILKSGAGYLPIETSYPAERIKYFLENSNVSYVLSNNDTLANGWEYKGEIININNILEMEGISTDNLHVDYDLSRIIYVIYTSGSTGNPKGVMVKLNSFVNLMNWYVNEFNITENDCNLLIAPVSFDLAQKNLYATLLTGGKLYLYPPDAYNYNLMSDIIEKEGVTLINCAPAAFYPLLDMNKDTDFYKLRHLRCTFLGGEALNLMKLKEWAGSRYFNAKILNTYGPTECTDIATYYDMSNMDPEQELSVPIGKPIDNVEVYILDKDMNLVPVGVDGELYIGGVGVSKGYLKDEAQTNAKFIEFNHFFNSPKKLYRTGDLVRWLPDGNIDFKGRIDFQVKIRGFRIELFEIERVLLTHDKVKDVVVIDKTDPKGIKYLCAYLVFTEEIKLPELIGYMLEQLPDYMIPSYFIPLQELPLNSNGKVDRDKLPAPEESCMAKGEEFLEPANEIEKQLVDLWKEVIGVEKISVVESFFNLGVNSLKIIVGASKIQKEMGVQIPISNILQHPTIRGTAHYILEELGANKADNFEEVTVDFDNLEFDF